MQRAAALKQQQKYLRELEEQNRPEHEKTRQVMSLGFNKQGKLVRTYQKERIASAAAVADGDDVEDSVEEQDQADGHELTSGSGAFSNNPLMRSGGLIRPIWKPKEGEEDKGKGRAEGRSNIWRRVQDDEDNEQWVL